MVDTKSEQEVHVCDDSIEYTGKDVKKVYTGSDVNKECTGSDVNNDRLLESFGDSNFEKDMQMLEHVASKSTRRENCQENTYPRGEYYRIYCLQVASLCLISFHRNTHIPYDKTSNILIDFNKFTKKADIHVYIFFWNFVIVRNWNDVSVKPE